MTTTDHTYLRYECADSFGLVVAGASSQAPPSNAILSYVQIAPPTRFPNRAASKSHRPTRTASPRSSSSSTTVIWTVAGSFLQAWNIKTCQAVAKVGHAASGSVGTGRALNADQVVCLDVVQPYSRQGTDDHDDDDDDDGVIQIATGWVDGSIRVWELSPHELTAPNSLAHSLLSDPHQDDVDGQGLPDWTQREALLLQGHASPVRALALEPSGSRQLSTTAPRGGAPRLASGGSDGTVILWDLVQETGLFRLLGHQGAITQVQFVGPDQGHRRWDGLITASLDGWVKVWDLQAQCCVQTVASHVGGQVWAAAVAPVLDHSYTANEDDKDADDPLRSLPPRWRLLTGGHDGQVRVWSIHQDQKETAYDAPTHQDQDLISPLFSTTGQMGASQGRGKDEAWCHYMGLLRPPANVVTSSERLTGLRMITSGGSRPRTWVGLLQANAKQVDVYRIRTWEESHKKRQRRLRRRQEKQKLQEKAASSQPDYVKGGRKRGILDDDDDDDHDQPPEKGNDDVGANRLEPEQISASDEFEYLVTVRSAHKVSGFTFVPPERGELARIVCTLATNALETHVVLRKPSTIMQSIIVAEKLETMDIHGHPTGVRSVSLSSDDRLACTVSKNLTKIWNVQSRSCIQTMAPTAGSKSKVPCYGLCSAFLPGNTHVVVGTKEGHLFLIDILAGDVVFCEENAHNGAIWAVDVRPPSNKDASVTLISGSQDKSVKFWELEKSDSDGNSQPELVHVRTLQMNDDVVATRYSNHIDSSQRLVFVSTLDCTIKVFFDDSLKLFLSLYGHKLPALAVDASDDDTILASAGADKTVKIWGLDFGDTHRTLYGHDDSITDLRFVKRTHNFFTASKDGTVRYWDGDRFEQILLLDGHFAEVNSLAISRTGAFVLSAGMDRQIRIWERTKDIVFLQEERERELEKIFDQVNGRDEGGTAGILAKNTGEDDDENDGAVGGEQPQSEAAVRKSVMSISSGDRIMEGLELADQELKVKQSITTAKGASAPRTANPLLLGMEPAQYVLWILRTIKSAELEQSLLVLSLNHVERLIYYLIVLLRSGRGIEICSRAAVFLVTTHKNQLIATRSLATPLRELKRLLRERLGEIRDIVGYDLAALRLIGRVAHDRKQSFSLDQESGTQDVWAGLGLGSDVAAALEGRQKPKKKR